MVADNILEIMQSAALECASSEYSYYNAGVRITTYALPQPEGRKSWAHSKLDYRQRVVRSLLSFNPTCASDARRAIRARARELLVWIR